MKFIYFLDINEEKVGGCSTKYFFERYYKDLHLTDQLSDSLKDRINAESNFQLSIRSVWIKGLLNLGKENTRKN